MTHTDPNEIDAVGIVNRAVVWVDDGEEKLVMFGEVDDGFTTMGVYLWKTGIMTWEVLNKAWDSLKTNKDIVFVDSSFALTTLTQVSISGMTLPIGKSILLIDISNPGNTREVVVGGVLSQSSQLFSQYLDER